MSQTTYNISWTTENADFLIQGSHQAIGADPALLQVASEGGIYFTPTADLLLTVDAAYDYNLAGPNLFTRMIFQVYPESNDPVEPIFTAGPHDDTYTGYPASGTLRINGQAIVPAGQTYLFSYSQYMSAHGNTGAVGIGDGYIHFTLSEVPEPATLFPLAVAVMAGSQTRRCRMRRSMRLFSVKIRNRVRGNPQSRDQIWSWFSRHNHLPTPFEGSPRAPSLE